MAEARKKILAILNKPKIKESIKITHTIPISTATIFIGFMVESNDCAFN